MERITIDLDAYKILLKNKRRNESFSEEITRITTRPRKKLSDLYGIISDKEAADMHKDLNYIRRMNIKLLEKRLKLLEIGKN